MENNNKLAVLGIILGFSLIITGALVSFTFYKIKGLDNTLSVTGSAKQLVTSDSVKWVGSFTRSVPLDSLKSGYNQMKQDQDLVTTFLKKQGVADTDTTFSPVFVDTPYKYNQNMPQTYDLRQTVEIKSSQVVSITELTKKLQPLIDQGVVFSTQSLEYYYTKLPELRVNLLSAAVKDAQARAQKIAESTGRSVGKIQSASMGVVQVMPVNSVEVADYGAYDTSSIDKEVMVTVKALFSLN